MVKNYSYHLVQIFVNEVWNAWSIKEGSLKEGCLQYALP